MTVRTRFLSGATVGVAVLSPLAIHSALALGQGYGVALALAGLQAVAVGVLLRRVPGPVGAAAPSVCLVLLAALCLGASRSAAAGLLVSAGVSHALLYGGLLLLFGRTLAGGRDSLVTGVARRLNPGFHSGMVPYTRAVTAAWCVFFAGQLAVSAVLLLLWPAGWRVFVLTVHAPLVLVMAVAEFAVRRWRWRHEHYTGLRDTIAGVRRLSRERLRPPPAAGRAAGGGADGAAGG